MIRINQLKMPLGHDRAGLLEKAARVLRVPSEEIERLTIVKQSVDARKKPDIWYSYVVDIGIRQAGLQKEEKLVRRLKDRNVAVYKEAPYRLPEPGTERMAGRPVIIGTGPAGLFCGLMLARKGYIPILLERGEDVDARTDRVARFWETGQLDPSSNVQFGEGGAGTFSDGKLNTLVKDTFGRNREVLRILTEFGGDPSILYVNKPHIGTDVLSRIVKSIRTEIEKLGGQVLFQSQVTDFVTEGEPGESRRIKALVVNGSQVLEAETVVLAIGHSARDTFARLKELAVPMQPKPFAVGIRVEHPQNMIDLAQYGVQASGKLPAADYKVTASTSTGRSVYSFCMCPGGYVVNAGSEPGAVAVNGMSYQARGGRNANSAIVVTVTPEDFGSTDILGGVEFQRRLERAAFMAGEGRVPVQLLKDFQDAEPSRNLGDIAPSIKGEWKLSDLRGVLPEVLSRSILEAMPLFDNKIPGFARPDSILSGVESRTSSPVRILRNPAYESEIQGLYPCGEGAGYAGGITSAAMDGMKTAEAIAQRYKPLA